MEIQGREEPWTEAIPVLTSSKDDGHRRRASVTATLAERPGLKSNGMKTRTASEPIRKDDGTAMPGNCPWTEETSGG